MNTKDSNMQAAGIEDLLERNRKWAERTAIDHPDLFPILAATQKPQILWLGCSDSRVPETTILDLLPGEIFVHRNIANVVPISDLNLLSVVQFAIDVLQVRHIILCGHHGCGGIKAVLDEKKLGLIDAWLSNIVAIRARHPEIEEMDLEARTKKLTEINVLEGVKNLHLIPMVTDAIKERGMQVHGMMFDVATGRLQRVVP